MASDSTEPGGPNFLFVTDHDRQKLRSHAMRTSLAVKRRESNEGKQNLITKTVVKNENEGEEDLLTCPHLHALIEGDTSTSGLDVNCEFCTCTLKSKKGKATSKKKGKKVLSRITDRKTKEDIGQQPTTTNKTFSSQHVAGIVASYQRMWKEGRASDVESRILYRDFTNFDPFESCPCKLRETEQGLMYHWIHVFGTMMFGKQHPSTDPMAEVWIPDAMTDKASFEGMLSYAAAHLAHLRQQEGSVQATMYKMKAIVSIQSQVNDSSKALSDSTVAAILRQISVEDRFGSLEIANMHRAGLEIILQKRGGAKSFRTNWNLELLYHWYLITSKPTFGFHRSKRQPSDISKDAGRHKVDRPSPPNQIPLLLESFWGLFDILGVPTPLEDTQHVSHNPISVAITPSPILLRLFSEQSATPRSTAHDIIAETCKLACLFYLAAIKADTMRYKTAGIRALNEALTATQPAWESSPETLLWVLLRCREHDDESWERIQLVCEVMKVAKLLQRVAWNALKEMLVCILWDDPEKNAAVMEGWMSLITEIAVMGATSETTE